MALKTDLRAYFKRKAIWSEGTVAKKQIANPEMLIPATENLNKQKLKWPQMRQNHYNIPKHIRIEVGKYGSDHIVLKMPLKNF